MSDRTIGRACGVFFGFVGVVVAACMLLGLGGFRTSLLWNIVQISPTVPSGAGLVLVFAGALGGRFGRWIAGSSWSVSALKGLVLSFLSLTLATVAAAVIYLVTEWRRYEADDLLQVLIKGPLIVGLFGLIPASVLGIAYGVTVRWMVVRRESLEPEDVPLTTAHNEEPDRRLEDAEGEG